MELWALILCVIPLGTSITVSSNGNSPEIKMVAGMMMDLQKGFAPMTPVPVETTTKTNLAKRKLNSNSTKLSINERYRRLIPYMTFYYANDLVSSTTEGAKNVEVEKAEIVEARTIQHQSELRQPKKVYYNTNRNIPLYHGNRLTQYNIASANPAKYLYKGAVPTPQNVKSNFSPLLTDHRGMPNNDFEYNRIVPKQIFKAPSAPFALPTRKPYLNLYQHDDSANLRYYFPEKEHTPKYKLVPYEQTPPVKVLPQNDNVYHVPKPVHVQIPQEQQEYTKPRPARPLYIFDNGHTPQSPGRKQPSIVSELYYEKSHPHNPIVQPIIESGFRPIVNTPIHTTETSYYDSSLTDAPVHTNYEFEKQQKVQVLDHPSEAPVEGVLNPNYYQYVVDQPAYKPPAYAQSNTVTLADLLNSLQLNKSIPKPITRENVGASIRTLLQVLNALKALPQQNEAEPAVLSTPTPFIQNKVVEVTAKPEDDVTPVSVVSEEADLQDEPYLAPVNTPSQHIDDYPATVSTSQRFPLQITSDDEGGTPGRPGVDYPVLTTIPQTAFNCKTQRYKGFFADPETRCQVWHYCDLNGGQASFLCPNGTIFSQAGLTCDWWFNVRCASTTQLYVLNESLYKYILPHSPKFPEDYSGPLVDKYLTLKFKEMEEQFKKNKNKQSASEKIDSEEESSTEDGSDVEASSEHALPNSDSGVSEASVIVGSPGTSGNVERLQD